MLIVDRATSAFPSSLLDAPVFSCRAAVVTSVDREEIRAKMSTCGARLYRRDDVIAVRQSTEEIAQLFQAMRQVSSEADRERREHEAWVRARTEARLRALVDGSAQGA